MLLALALFMLAAGSSDRVTVSTVPCGTVAECWLDDAGRPIARPKANKRRKLPVGDCGRNLLWLHNRLSCDNNVCTAEFIGDKC